MNRSVKSIIITVTAFVATIAISIGTPKTVLADEAADAQALAQAQALQLQLLMQTPEYQAALKAQQEAQAKALAQYQAALQQQYQAALLVYNNAQYLQQRAVNQTYLLNAIQAQQKAGYESMINTAGLDYKSELMKRFTDNQYKGITAYKGYTGVY